MTEEHNMAKKKELTHEELLERCGLYQEIFDSQFPGEREKKEGNV